jgi:hypothetical protein
MFGSLLAAFFRLNALLAARCRGGGGGSSAAVAIPSGGELADLAKRVLRGPAAGRSGECALVEDEARLLLRLFQSWSEDGELHRDAVRERVVIRAGRASFTVAGSSRE